MTGRTKVGSSFAVLIWLVLVAGGAGGQEVQGALDATAALDEAARRSQGTIDRTVEETQSLERQYSVLTKEIDGLEVYNLLLRKQLESQEKEMKDLASSIDQVSIIERQVMPLMVKMIDSLEQFIELDMPFLLEERRQRVAFLKTVLDRSDVSVAEKLRRLLEAYEIENDYGRTIEVYKGTLEIAGATRAVDFLRIGRVALLYQTADAATYGMWDREQQSWVRLSAEYRNQIRAGIKMAQKQIAPDLVLIPVPAAEAAR